MADFFRRLTPWQASLLLVVLASMLRLVASTHVGLGTDEAHYALYGLHLDSSYYDHPPLIGWLQALVLLVSDSDLALRIMPTLLFAATALALHRVTITLFPHETPWLGFISVVLLQSGVMFQLIGLSMLPDDPLLLLGLLTLLALHLILADNRLRHWLWLGVLLGLAGLSKYTAVTLVATVLLAMVPGRLWAVLRSAGPWLAMLAASLLITPVLYWNYTHDWISFAYQLHHGTANADWSPTRAALAQLAQLLVYGPGIFVFGLITLVASLRDWRERGVWLCLALAVPVLLLFGWNSGYQMTLPHWVSLGWAGLIPLIARWLHRHWNRRWVRISVRGSAAYALLVIAILLSEFFMPWLPFQDNENPLRDLYGWVHASHRADELRAELATTPGAAPLLFTENWTYASRLAWYARPAPVQVLDTRYDQFDIWFGSPQDGARGILVVWPEQKAPPVTGGPGQFARCELRDTVPVMSRGHLVSTFTFYACDEFRR
ncbi:MAG: glycosyltransferase family 39 protein [Nitrosomonadales bacterium]|nr:glycosyltransferase family 39 protein [Nitrosomonadales bacterium]